MTAFASRLATEFRSGRRLCAGIDPHAFLLAEWGLPDSAAGAERMGRDVVAAAAGVACAVKPQIAFFERFGAAGYAALERVFADARQAGLLLIADVKRGDVGSSFDAYAQAWLGAGSPLEADAMTVSAFQGFGTLGGALDAARAGEKGVFVLAATSNPEAFGTQTARVQTGPHAGETVSAQVLAEIAAFNAEHPVGPVGAVGAVLGATLDLAAAGVDVAAERGPVLPVLAPGFGFQGARVADARATFGALSAGLIVSESRSVLNGGAAGLAERIRERAEAVTRELGEDTHG